MVNRETYQRLSSKSKGGKGLSAISITVTTKPTIHHFSRHGGVKPISALLYQETRGVLEVSLENQIPDAIT